MRVVYVATIDRGGPISHLQLLAPAVARAGIDVHVVCANESLASSFRADGVDASVVAVRSKTDLRGAARIRPALRGADIVHTHDRRAGLFARPIARLIGSRPVHTLHGLPEEIAVRFGRTTDGSLPRMSPARVAWFRWGYPRIETVLASLGHVIVPSEAMVAFLVDHGLSRRRVHVIPNGIDAQPRRVRSPDTSALRLVTVANLEYWKGVDVVIDACARTRAKPRLDVYGDGSERVNLVERARAAGVEAVFHGFVTDVRGRLPEADVFVLTSRGDNAPVSVLEAMACELPVVATWVGGIPELVTKETGVLVAPDDVVAVAAAIDRLAEDGELRSRLGARGAERVAKHFSLERTVDATIGLYEDLCGSSM
jgi:glycosyltransferase involved in cell wall biosynthesis